MNVPFPAGDRGLPGIEGWHEYWTFRVPVRKWNNWAEIIWGKRTLFLMYAWLWLIQIMNKILCALECESNVCDRIHMQEM